MLILLLFQVKQVSGQYSTQATAIIDNDSDSKTEVRNLSAGKNLFVWTITNGFVHI